MKVLVFDPSGNFKEGSGTTGWSYFEDSKLNDFGAVAATDHPSAENYWQEVCDMINYPITQIVCESYKLFAHKSKQQHWSEMETPQLIGMMRGVCHSRGIPIDFQDPSLKVRVADPILVHMGVLQKQGGHYKALGRPTNLHMRDAIRHGVYWHRYKVKQQ